VALEEGVGLKGAAILAGETFVRATVFLDGSEDWEDALVIEVAVALAGAAVLE
jgi:hypothetical protein